MDSFFEPVAEVESKGLSSLFVTLKPEQSRIAFANEKVLALDGRDERYPFWQAALEQSKADGSPVFVAYREDKIAFVGPSSRGRVAVIYDDERLEVSFTESHAIIGLSGPNQKEMLGALREAEAAGEDVYYSYHGGTMELLAVKRAGAPEHAPPEVVAAEQPIAGALGTADNPMTMQQARNLFRMIKQEEELIPFAYPADCCMTRAAEMRRRLREVNADCLKAYVQAHMAGTGTPTRLIPRKFEGRIRWTFHIAPLVYVREQGVTAEAVIDPSMFEDVVPRQSWVQAMPDTAAGGQPQMNIVVEGTVYAPSAPWKTAYAASDWIREKGIDQIRRRFTEHWVRYYGRTIDLGG